MKACRSLPSTFPVPAVPPPVRGTFTGAVRPRAPNAVVLVVVILRSLAVPLCSVIAPPLIVGATPVIAAILFIRSWTVPVVTLIWFAARFVGVVTMLITVVFTVIVSPGGPATKLVVSESVFGPPFNRVDGVMGVGVGVSLLFLAAPTIVASP